VNLHPFHCLQSHLSIRSRVESMKSEARCCGAPNQLGHDEICLRRAPWTVARHEQAKRVIGTALATVEGVQVHLEPLITGTQRRNDIRITGSAAVDSQAKTSTSPPSPCPPRISRPPRFLWLPLRTTLRPKGLPNSLRNTSTPWQGKNDAGTHLRTDHSGLSSSPLAV
jgi:hypothetical protein